MASSVRGTQLENRVQTLDHVGLHCFHGLEHAGASGLDGDEQGRGVERGEHSAVLLLQRVAADDVLRGGGGAAVDDARELVSKNRVAVLSSVVLRLSDQENVAAALNARSHSVVHVLPALRVETVVSERNRGSGDQRFCAHLVEVVGELGGAL